MKILDNTNLGYLLGKIKAAFWRKSETSELGIDSTPTANSDNLVTSGGVHTSLSGKQDTIDSSHKLSADLVEDGTTNKVINVKPDWNAAAGNAAEILNKPTLFSGNYNDLTHKPTLGSAARLDVPSSGNATSSQVVKGDDSRLSDARTPTSHKHTTSDITGFPTIPDAVSGTNDGTNWTSLTIGSVTKNIPSGGGGGLSNHDFTHTANTTVSTSSTTITFAANTRGSQMITVSDDIAISFVVNNDSDNYLWIENSDTTNNIDVTISSVTHNGNVVSNVRMPRDGIAVPAGGTCEIGIVCNTDGAFITSRDDLE